MKPGRKRLIISLAVAVALLMVAMVGSEVEPVPEINLEDFELISQEMSAYYDPWNEVGIEGVIRCHWAAGESNFLLYFECPVFQRHGRLVPIPIGANDEFLVSMRDEREMRFWRFSWSSNWEPDWACYQLLRNGVFEVSQKMPVPEEFTDRVRRWLIEQINEIEYCSGPEV